MEIVTTKLNSDCGACSGLCCAALFFAKADGFPEDKNMGTPCVNLQRDFRCAVHGSLAERGLHGCMAYDCFGAGQKVTALFGGDTWRNRPSRAGEIFEAFLTVRMMNQMLWYLCEAWRIEPSAEIRALIAENEEAARGPEVAAFDVYGYKARVDRVLKRITGEVRKTANGKRADADCIGKSFRGRNLYGTDFSMSLLIAADFEGCALGKANFLGADMRGANIRGADLSQSLFLTQIQVNAADGDHATKLPPGLSVPTGWAGASPAYR
ncbi:MAG: hypothetical protein DELT_03186 [Desulfovibrio sp.]|uniref:pentapeptide repeat-containing protein n=1 Tax=Christensenella intestinihominis TaxID=1851429 RepID=UPI0008361712|nr:pentapeptide repeat-containing protein [Christensenella intestinihominis]